MPRPEVALPTCEQPTKHGHCDRPAGHDGRCFTWNPGPKVACAGCGVVFDDGEPIRIPTGQTMARGGMWHPDCLLSAVQDDLRFALEQLMYREDAQDTARIVQMQEREGLL